LHKKNTDDYLMLSRQSKLAMKVSWRRSNFLKAPKFENTWVDEFGRTFMIIDKSKMSETRWAIVESAEWGDLDRLAYVRVGKDDNGEPNEMPEEGDVISAQREGASVRFAIIQVFRSVGRTKTVPLIVQPV
jgi:hypothetical protein